MILIYCELSRISAKIEGKKLTIFLFEMYFCLIINGGIFDDVGEEEQRTHGIFLPPGQSRTGQTRQ